MRKYQKYNREEVRGGKKIYKATGVTCILCMHRRDSIQYITNCKTKYWLDHHLRPRLATGWRTWRTDTNSTGKALKTDGHWNYILSTEDWSEFKCLNPNRYPGKTEMSTFSKGFKQDLESHDTIPKRSRTQSRIIWHINNKKNLSLYRKRQSTNTNCRNYTDVEIIWLEF